MALDRSKVDVHVVDIDPFVNNEFCGFSIHWAGNIGFGEYTIYKAKDSDRWCANSEMMDSQDDKWFLNLLLCDLADQLVID